MVTNLNDLFLAPGDLVTLFTSCGIEVSPESVLAGSPLLAPSASANPMAEIASGVDIAELNIALQALAAPSLIISGLRSARRMEPWPFFIFRRTGGPAVILAPEGGGFARFRFLYSDETLLDWLAGPFRRFAAPGIPCAEFPALTASGMAVILAMVDIFRNRYPDLDPDWNAAEPVAFTSEEVIAMIAAEANGGDPSSLMNRLARLGGPKPETLSLETVESLLYVFSNEGYLAMDLSPSTPLFTMTESFIGTALSLAWWDMSFSLESRLGCGDEPIRFIQGLAVWRFITGSDNRTRMQAVSGEEIETAIRALLSLPAIPQTRPSLTHELSSRIPSTAMRDIPVSRPQPPSVASTAAPVIPPVASSRSKDSGTDFSQTRQFDCPPEPSGSWHGPTAPGGRQCPNCRAASSKPNARFCSVCGKEFPKHRDLTQFCTKCGVQLNPEAGFCSACGQRV
jgi:hypothetical protein